MSEESQNTKDENNNDNKLLAAQETAKKVVNSAVDKADELYNKLPLDKINEKLNGKVNVKSRKFKMILSGIVCFLLLVCVFRLFGGNSNKQLTPRQIKFAEEFLFDKFQLGQSIKFGCGVLQPDILKNSIKYCGKNVIDYNDCCEEAGVVGEKGMFFTATAVYRATNNPSERFKDKIVIIIYKEKLLCIPEDNY